MDHERDELLERRRSRLSLAGREILEDAELAMSQPYPPDPAELVERIRALPPEEGEEVAAIFGVMAQGFAERQRENTRKAAQAASFKEIILEAQERERAAGRPVDPHTTVGDALEILGR